MDLNLTTLTTPDLTTTVFAAYMDEDMSSYIAEISARAVRGDMVAENFLQRRRAL